MRIIQTKEFTEDKKNVALFRCKYMKRCCLCWSIRARANVVIEQVIYCAFGVTLYK